MKRLIFLTLACVFCMPMIVRGEDPNIGVEAIADSMVDYLTPNVSYPSDPNIGIHRIRYDGAVTEGPCDSIKNLFARFQLPNGLTGQQIGNIIEANIKITQIQDGVNAGLGYYVFGVKDGLDTASCNTYTWNNAPGYNPLNIKATLSHLDYFDEAEAYWLGNINTYYPGTFTMYHVSANMSQWILEDTDGILTIFITGYQPYNYLKHFASIENTDIDPATDEPYRGPRLEFTYSLVPPKCGDPGQLYSPGDYNKDCYVNFADLAVFVGYWLDCTDRANSLCQ